MNREQIIKLQRKLSVTMPRSEISALSGAEQHRHACEGRDSFDERCAESRDLGLREQQEYMHTR